MTERVYRELAPIENIFPAAHSLRWPALFFHHHLGLRPADNGLTGNESARRVGINVVSMHEFS